MIVLIFSLLKMGIWYVFIVILKGRWIIGFGILLIEERGCVTRFYFWVVLVWDMGCFIGVLILMRFRISSTIFVMFLGG